MGASFSLLCTFCKKTCFMLWIVLCVRGDFAPLLCAVVAGAEGRHFAGKTPCLSHPSGPNQKSRSHFEPVGQKIPSCRPLEGSPIIPRSQPCQPTPLLILFLDCPLVKVAGVFHQQSSSRAAQRLHYSTYEHYSTQPTRAARPHSTPR